MTATDLEICRDALKCLREYWWKAPSGIAPKGRNGHNVPAVMEHLALMIDKYEPPAIKLITTKVRALDPDAWKD